MFERLRGRINACQEKALVSLFRAGPDGFIGGMSERNYASITRADRQTAAGDLNDLLAKGALTRTGTCNRARYWLNIPGWSHQG